VTPTFSARKCRAARWLIGVCGVFLSAALTAGCASPPAIAPGGTAVRALPAAEMDARAESVRREPLAYLRRVAESSARLQQYTLTLTRQERRGLIPRLAPSERIAAWYRRSPLSVRFKWLEDHPRYGESVYVENQAGGRVRFVPREGLFGLEPRVVTVDVNTPVIWGESHYPITDFGLEELMRRTLNSIAEAGDVRISYQGVTTLGRNGRYVHHLRLEYPPTYSRTPVQELFIDVATDLPAGTLLKLASGALDSAYLYEDVNPDASLTDNDFLLECERASAPANSPPGRSRGQARQAAQDGS
jgi:hypothetical protein